MLQTDLLTRVLQFPVQTITKKMLSHLKKDYTEHPDKKMYFIKDQIAKKSKAAAGLSQWILAVQSVAQTIHKLKNTEKSLKMS